MRRSLVAAVSAVLVVSVLPVVFKNRAGTGGKGVMVFDGAVAVKESREISFRGTVRKVSGKVDFLLYLPGYRWLEESSAITGDTGLPGLQDAAAWIDWQLWDALYTGTGGVPGEQPLLLIGWNGKMTEATHLVTAGEGEELSFDQLVFIGSPYLDSAVLNHGLSDDCAGCPLYGIEKEAVTRKLTRKSGSRGYFLNTGELPPEGSRVDIKIRL